MLDWLARNVHGWDTDTNLCLAYRGNRGQFQYEFGVKKGFTRQQWLDRRAELQNKPSWKDAPEWAEWLAQDKDGVWLWCGDEPITGERGWNHRAAPITQGGQGKVLGDWKDTLELRPADLSEQAVTARLQEATDHVLAAVPELKSDKYKFEPFTSLEDAQPMGEDKYAPEPLSLTTLHTVHHAAFLHQSCQLLLNEPELVVFRTADGELIHCKPKECLIDPDVYGLAARLLTDMSGHQVAPEHMRELVEQMNWRVE